MIGPQNMISGQYEYIVLSNWAKYPTIAMARDIGEFSAKYRNVLVERFKREGYIHELSEYVNLFFIYMCALAASVDKAVLNGFFIFDFDFFSTSSSR